MGEVHGFPDEYRNVENSFGGDDVENQKQSFLHFFEEIWIPLKEATKEAVPESCYAGVSQELFFMIKSLCAEDGEIGDWKKLFKDIGVHVE